jgi:hypothetical protein
MSYVITCGDEGVQINEGKRLGIVGAGFRLEHFSAVVTALKAVFGKEISIVSSEENDWVKEVLQLSEWDQVNASMQQHIEALADREKISYAGNLLFSDPKQLKNDIKGHMVRPHNIHVASKICFTLAGGEQQYNLGCYLVSADWLHQVDTKVARSVIQTQVEFYKKLSKKDLKFVFEEQGELDKAIVAKNRKILEKIGITAS